MKKERPEAEKSLSDALFASMSVPFRLVLCYSYFFPCLFQPFVAGKADGRAAR